MMLGNLSLERIEKRTGVVFPEPFRSKFTKLHQSSANNIKKGKWHCFDIPFMLVCGGKELFEEVKENLLPLSDKFEVALNVSYTETT